MTFQPADWPDSFDITIDYTKIDADLENFPVLVTLISGTAGINDFNSNNIFEALEGNVDDGIDGYTVMLWRAPWDSSQGHHAFKLDRGITIVEPGYEDFEMAFGFDGDRANIWIENSRHIEPTVDKDYTIEFWMRSTNTSAFNAFHFGAATTDNLVMRFDDTHGINLFWESDGGEVTQRITSGSVGDYSDGVWRHFALVRHGSLFKLYINAVEIGRAVAPLFINTAGTNREAYQRIGSSETGITYNLEGDLSGIRISQTARYLEGDFTLPTSNFVKDIYTTLLIQEKVDYAGNQCTWLISNTGNENRGLVCSSAEEPFGRTIRGNNTQSVATYDNLDTFDIGLEGESFTIDCWMNIRVAGGYSHGICGMMGDANYLSGGLSWRCCVTSEDMYFIYWNGATSYVLRSYALDSIIEINEWSHYAFVNNKETNTFRFFYNGKQVYEVPACTMTHNPDVGTLDKRFEVGSAQDWIAYKAITEIRVSKGIARWHDNFQTPNAPYGSSSWFNRKKIAFTTTISGVPTETFAEIDYWYDGNFYRQYTPAYQANPVGAGTDGSGGKYVKATTQNSTGYRPVYSCRTQNARYGPQTNGNWITPGGVLTDQKFNVDLGKPILADRMMLDNSHDNSASLQRGIKNFSVYGTNSQAAFENVTYADTTDLNHMGDFQARRRWPGWNEPDSQYFDLTNNGIEYRYYVLRIADSCGSADYFGLRHVQFQQNTRKARIYVKVPSVSSVSGTVLSLYYDKNKADNTSYIGDTFDDVVNYVWDNNYLGVWHLSGLVAQAYTQLTTDAMRDSTSNDNHGDTLNDFTRENGNNSLEYLWFQTSNANYDYVSFGNLGSASEGTIEFSMLTHDISDYRNVFTTYHAGGNDAIRFEQYTSGEFKLFVTNGGVGTSEAYDLTGTPTESGIESFISYAWSSTTSSGYGFVDDNPAWPGILTDIPDTFTNVAIGTGYDTAENHGFVGIIDEVRISNIQRSKPWLKASYYSNSDGLLTYAVGQIPPYISYVCEGTVSDWSGYISGVPIRSYRRSDGAFIAETTSTASGTFQVLCSSQEEHYITALNPYTGVNAIIYDRVTPSGVII